MDTTSLAKSPTEGRAAAHGLPRTMRSFRRVARDSVVLTEIPRPEPAAGELLIRPLLSGPYGTDLHVLSGEELGALPVPLTMGHEVCGEVVAVSHDGRSSVPYPRAGRPPALGDRVVVE